MEQINTERSVLPACALARADAHSRTPSEPVAPRAPAATPLPDYHPLAACYEVLQVIEANGSLL